MNNWKKKVLTSALALSILVPTASFAADAVTTEKDIAGKKVFAHHQRFKGEQQPVARGQILDLAAKYTPEDVDQWQSALTEQEQLMAKLKEKAPAQKQRPQLSAEVKEKFAAIREDVKNGTITSEQAREEMKKLGFEGRQPMARPEMSQEVKEKFEAIRADVESGKITQDQAKEEMKKLAPNRGSNPMADLRKAVEDNDETRLKELLPQLLVQLQERNQKLSASLER